MNFVFFYKYESTLYIDVKDEKRIFSKFKIEKWIF